MPTKILFYLDRDEKTGYPPVEVESLWALPRDEGYELDNVPFYAKGVALGDIVIAEPDAGGALVYRRVVGRGGHSTYRIFLLEPGRDQLSELVSRTGIEPFKGRAAELRITPVQSPSVDRSEGQTVVLSPTGGIDGW